MKEQIRDLMFFIEAKEKIEKSGNLNEAKDGQLVVVSGEQTTNNNRKQKKKR